MTGPEEPGDDWAFPEVPTPSQADPTSFELPVEESEQVYDTGSDAWWRQQAEAQRRAAQSEPVVPPAPPAPPAAPVEPPALVEPTVLSAPSPLDRDWLPAELPELRAPMPSAAEEPVYEEPVYEEPVDVAPVPEEPVYEEPAAAEPVDEEPVYEEPVDVAPVPEEPVYDEPVAAEPVDEQPLAVDDLRPTMRVPLTRPPHEGERVGPARAVAGALLAVAGVGLGVGALLLYGKDEPKGGAAVDAPPTATAPATTAPTSAGTPTAKPTTKPTTAPTAAPSPTDVVVVPASPALAPMAPVDVLNNSRIKGLADRGAARFRAGGWTVPLTGNYSGGTIAKTTIYFAPGQQASATRFARQFGIPRVLPRFAGLPGSGLTVVLTRDYQ